MPRWKMSEQKVNDESLLSWRWRRTVSRPLKNTALHYWSHKKLYIHTSNFTIYIYFTDFKSLGSVRFFKNELFYLARMLVTSKLAVYNIYNVKIKLYFKYFFLNSINLRILKCLLIFIKVSTKILSSTFIFKHQINIVWFLIDHETLRLE